MTLNKVLNTLQNVNGGGVERILCFTPFENIYRKNPLWSDGFIRRSARDFLLLQIIEY